MVRNLMTQRPAALTLLLFFAACGESRPPQIADPIADIPGTQQRTVTRSERWDWPFTVGTGTLGCTSGAVVFRAGGVSYSVNERREVARLAVCGAHPAESRFRAAKQPSQRADTRSTHASLRIVRGVREGRGPGSL
jgi:hypothetical protein